MTTPHVATGTGEWGAGDNIALANEQSTTFAFADQPGGPTWKVEVADTVDPLAASPTWTDVTQWVMRLQFHRGRQDELDDANPGRATVLFDDPTRVLEPGSDLEPGRRIRISTTAPSSAVMWHGVIDDITTTLGRYRNIEHRVDCVDLLALVAAETVTSLADGAGDGERSGARVERVLDAVGIPAGLQAVDTGRSTLPAHVEATTNALAYLNKITVTEGGRLFAAGDGSVTFLERYATTPAVSLTISDASGDTPPPVVETRYGVDRVFTIAECDWVGGNVRTEDVDNTPVSGPRSRRFDTFIDNELAAITFTEWMLMLRSTPLRRVSQCQFVCTNQTMTAALLGVELGDRVQFVRTPDTGSAISITGTVEYLGWQNEGVTSICTLGLSPTITDYSPWTWSDGWDDASKVWAY